MLVLQGVLMIFVNAIAGVLVTGFGAVQILDWTIGFARRVLMSS